MTKLEYRDLLVATSLAGGFPAVEKEPDGRVACRYRTSTGKRCAVGLILPDANYAAALEGKGVFVVQGWKEPEKYDQVNRAVGEPPAGMTWADLQRVQREHDFLATPCVYAGHAWPHDAFVAALNQLPCFADLAPAPLPATTTPDPAPCATP